LPLDRRAGAGTTESGRRRNLVAGVRGGAVVVSSQKSRLESVLGSLAQAAQTPGQKPPPESVDDVWLRMPENAPRGFVIRDPGIWAPRVVVTIFGKVRSPALQSIADALPDLLEGTPGLVGEGKIVAPDTVEITVRWSWSVRQDTFGNQQRNLNLLIQNANALFSRIEGVHAEALPLSDAATGRVGLRIRIEGWSRLFPIVKTQ